MPDGQDQPLWVTNGLADLNFHETGDNQGIEKFIAQAHCGEVGQPWCAIWANAKLEQSGVHGTRSPAALSFTKDANFVKLAGPALGALAVYTRGAPGSGHGHVGFYMGETQTQILTLGGNESDAVREQFEPRARLVGFFWPKSVPQPAVKVITVTSKDGQPVGSND
jgi:uncharacterized protein (TIGR02594 family)